MTALDKFAFAGIMELALILASTEITNAINRINLGQVQASFVGENEGDEAGWMVSISGDVNGDGFDDIVIGSYGNDSNGENSGQVYLILGRSDGWQMRTPLSDADASFVGEEELDGASICEVVDINGDEYDDILIGAPSSSWRNDERVGQVYLIWGQADGWSKEKGLSNANASFLGIVDWGLAGFAISGGDVDSDGFDDFFVSATSSMPGENNPGWTYLILGKSDGWRMRTKLSQANALFVGENQGDQAGWAISVAGDVNGDGHEDLLIGAPKNDYNGDKAGQAYLIFGNSDIWEAEVSLSDAGASFVGEYAMDNAGVSVAGPGDVNDDGYDDILIGAYGSSDGIGQAYLVFGKSTGWSIRTPLSQADASFIGEGKKDKAGIGLSKIGDINEDGYDDILIGATGGSAYPPSEYDTGRVYLIFGGSGPWVMRTPLSNADIAFEAEELGDLTGAYVSRNGDVNGDGRNDILIGAIENDAGGVNAGQVYLVLDIPATITTPALAEGCINEPYETVLSATLGTSPYSWSIESGSLPAGLEMDSAGVISGVPTSGDTSEITIQVTDAASDTNTKSFTIIIRQSGGKGDINGDCDVNIVDVISTINIILELFYPTPTETWAADCDDNGIVNIIDAICLVNKILEGGDLK